MWYTLSIYDIKIGGDIMDERHGYYDESFGVLHDYIGQTVYCVWNNRGTRSGLKGILSSVAPYDAVSIEGQLIPFVDPSLAIEGIFTEDKNPIYRNYKAGEYLGCDLESEMDLAKEQASLLGYSIVMEAIDPSAARDAGVTRS